PDVKAMIADISGVPLPDRNALAALENVLRAYRRRASALSLNSRNVRLRLKLRRAGTPPRRGELHYGTEPPGAAAAALPLLPPAMEVDTGRLQPSSCTPGHAARRIQDQPECFCRLAIIARSASRLSAG